MRTIAAVTAAGVIATAFAADSFADCIGNLLLDFNDNAFPAQLVVTHSTGCETGTTSVSGGELVITRPAGISVNCANGAALSGQDSICGDFDVQIDFNLVNFPTPQSGTACYATLVVEEVATSNFVGIERYDANYSSSCLAPGEYYKYWQNSVDDCNSNFIPSGDQVGKFRISRVGSAWSAYYWTLNGWSLAHAYTAGMGPVSVGVYTGRASSESQEVHFDNLRILGNLTTDVGESVAPVALAMRVLGNPGARNFGLQVTTRAGSNARLDVFDIQGRLVSSTLVRGGSSELRLLNTLGAAKLPSGLYVVRLTQSGASISRKVCLLE